MKKEDRILSAWIGGFVTSIVIFILFLYNFKIVPEWISNALSVLGFITLVSIVFIVMLILKDSVDSKDKDC